MVAGGVVRFRIVLSTALLLGWAIACATTDRPAAAYPINDRVRSCPDPSIIRGQQPGDPYWYLYCTASPLDDEDRDVRDNYRLRLVLIQRSLDLLNWEYLGDVFSARPAAPPPAGRYRSRDRWGWRWWRRQRRCRRRAGWSRWPSSRGSSGR